MTAEEIQPAVMCDRCTVPTPATDTVRCWYGCDHRQCARCAEQTAKESTSP